MNLKIRKAQPKDWKIIQKLNSEVFTHSAQFDKHLNLKWPSSKIGINYYKKITSDKDYCCLIAEIKGKPVAYLAGLQKNYDYRTNKVGEIDNMGTSPRFRSQGIGTQLVQEFKKWCKKQNLTHIYVCTYCHSKHAINFYKKQGLQPINISLEGEI